MRWAESWGESDRTCGADFPSVHSLPHMGARAAEFAAAAAGPQGEQVKIEKSFISRIVEKFTSTDEVEKLRKLIQEINNE